MTKQSSGDVIVVCFTPTSGRSRTEKVNQVEAPLDAVLKAAKMSGKNCQISIDNEPVTDMNTVVHAGQVVAVTEKARGS